MYRWAPKLGTEAGRQRRGGFLGKTPTVRFGMIIVMFVFLILSVYKKTGFGLPTGPIDDIFRRHAASLAIIYGTGATAGDQALRDYALIVSKSLGARLKQKIPVYSDREAGRSVLEKKSLILYGPVEQNRVERGMREHFPFTFSGDTVSLGAQRVSGLDWRLVFIIPNPYNTRQYALIYTGPAAERVVGINMLGSPNFVPHDSTDYVLSVGDRVVRKGFFEKKNPTVWKFPAD
jgi:hypothetical protein